MTKPQPIAEIVIEMRGDNHLIIYTSSPDALSWLLDNANEFGFMFELNNCYLLNVHPTWNLSEVAAYIRTMGAPEQADLSAFNTAPPVSDGDAADTGE